VQNIGPVDGPLNEDYELEDAYLRVTKVVAGRSVATAYIEARTADATQHVCNLPPVQFPHDRSAEAVEITTQAYNYLKSLESYAEAEDC